MGLKTGTQLQPVLDQTEAAGPNGPGAQATWTAPSDITVVGFQISARPNTGTPTAAQLNGIARCVAFMGAGLPAGEKDFPPTQNYDLIAGVDLFCDGHVSMRSNMPVIIKCRRSIKAGEKFTLACSRGIDSGGVGMSLEVISTPLYESADPGTQGYRAV